MKRYVHWHGLTLLALFAGCHYDTDQDDGAFYNWDHRTVHCAIDIDTFARNDIDSVRAGLDRAAERGEVLELYAHDPGRTVDVSVVQDVLQAAADRHLTFFTYEDIVDDVAPSGGLLLSFDDAYVDDWLPLLPTLQQFGAHVTFFIAYYPTLSPSDHAGIETLAAAGHAIEPHSIHHLRAPLYVEQKGLPAYMADEALPSIQHLRDDAFAARVYAYPYGARTRELDDELAAHVALVRSVAFTWSGPADPCPD